MSQRSRRRRFIDRFALIGLLGVAGQTWALPVAYVANVDSNNVSAYTIAAGTGVLTPMAGSPFAAGTSPSSVTVSPNGAFAYVTNVDSDNVSAYTIAAATGVLTPVAGSPFTVGVTPTSVTTAEIPAPTRVVVPSGIPTLSEWGMILLSALVVLFALVQVRRRDGATSS